MTDPVRKLIKPLPPPIFFNSFVTKAAAKKNASTSAIRPDYSVNDNRHNYERKITGNHRPYSSA